MVDLADSEKLIDECGTDDRLITVVRICVIGPFFVDIVGVAA